MRRLCPMDVMRDVYHPSITHFISIIYVYMYICIYIYIYIYREREGTLWPIRCKTTCMSSMCVCVTEVQSGKRYVLVCMYYVCMHVCRTYISIYIYIYIHIHIYTNITHRREIGNSGSLLTVYNAYT